MHFSGIDPLVMYRWPIIGFWLFMMVLQIYLIVREFRR